MWRGSSSTLHRLRRRTVRRGVSLLEAVAALAIVGATSAGVLTMTGSGVRTAERSRRAHEAEALANEQLTRLLLAPSEALRALPDSLAAGIFAAPFDDYAWDAVVRGDAQFPGLFTVELTVQWDGGAQTLTTRFYRRAGTRPAGEQ